MLGSAIVLDIFGPLLAEIEDLPAEDAALAERVKRVLYSVQRVVPGDGDGHLAGARQRATALCDELASSVQHW